MESCTYNIFCKPERFNMNILQQLFEYIITFFELTAQEHKFKR